MYIMSTLIEASFRSLYITLQRRVLNAFPPHGLIVYSLPSNLSSHCCGQSDCHATSGVMLNRDTEFNHVCVAPNLGATTHTQHV